MSVTTLFGVALDMSVSCIMCVYGTTPRVQVRGYTIQPMCVDLHVLSLLLRIGEGVGTNWRRIWDFQWSELCVSHQYYEHLHPTQNALSLWPFSLVCESTCG